MTATSASSAAFSSTPRQQFVQCISPSGLHRVAYTEWGERDNPRVLVCVHGLTRSGRDFDRLAAALSGRYRVVCPDVVGRGLSSWLADPNGYGIAQYVADMVTLIARLGVARVDWFGTSMGGLIGMALAGLPDAPIGRMVLNDVGPHIEPVSLERIGSYLGNDERFSTQQDGIDRAAQLARSFGPLSADEWREINTPLLHEVDGTWRFRYDPRIAQPFAAVTPEQNAAGEAFLWRAFAAIKGPVLVVRGAESDLLSRETVAKMVETGQRVSSVEIEGVGHAPAFLAVEQIDVARRFFDGAPADAS
ncbi:alpha/beta fold hydrolase [Paraburkholderia caballeronis]|uniref:alpha/beta fold hydrolase n=1 Tax=Paraburkholderia caballeronis TaxID=416943 RepID=UPI0010650485|nr:alpha/beta hydrolase [Paraburkholderia caballeronis]TDV09431.1 pimeloyl-ACP methyl ester carboxylesterase [Paraburkholderia caballeronis]TDV13702.1 pimeloyl-ACP methyl ester carboxylesterase [Paraburkholderia caballeronis]TDV22884.1 pimeloyl-ACP methyl ester carboxylesterase [Paraburkholderia caballeronis]